jgi:hypothetical protein
VERATEHAAERPSEDELRDIVCIRQLPLVHREHLPAAADEGFELCAVRYRRDGVARLRHVPPVWQVPHRRDEDRVLPENTRLGLGEVRRPDEAAASAVAFACHRRRTR